MNEQSCLWEIYEYIREKVKTKPKIGIVLGSGWGDCINELEIEEVLTFDELPFFPKSTVAEHEGKMIFGELNQIPIVVLQGRVHYYEGYEMYEVIRPIRVFKMLGVKRLVLTNAAGAINCGYQIGDIIALKDHISSFVPNPLRGENLDTIGKRFPDMSEIYDSKMLQISKEVGKRMGLEMKQGVYLQTAGPSFESAAEIKMYGFCGADLVGMSTVCEAIAAIHAEMSVAAFSFVSNMACGITKEKLSMEEVVINSNKQKSKCSEFIVSFIQAIAREEN